MFGLIRPYVWHQSRSKAACSTFTFKVTRIISGRDHESNLLSSEFTEVRIHWQVVKQPLLLNLCEAKHSEVFSVPWLNDT